jgi:hypothetical protein
MYSIISTYLTARCIEVPHFVPAIFPLVVESQSSIENTLQEVQLIGSIPIIQQSPATDMSPMFFTETRSNSDLPGD